jgi:hypothetical protein
MSSEAVQPPDVPSTDAATVTPAADALPSAPDTSAATGPPIGDSTGVEKESPGVEQAVSSDAGQGIITGKREAPETSDEVPSREPTTGEQGGAKKARTDADESSNDPESTGEASSFCDA